MNRKPILLNRKGNFVILSLGLTAVGGVVVMTGIQISQSILKDRLYQKEKINIEKASTSAISLLQDQSFCSAFFKGGYQQTGSGVFNFSGNNLAPGTPVAIADRINSLNNQLKGSTNFAVESIELSNAKVVNDSTLENLKIFDVSVNIKQNTNQNGSIFKVAYTGSYSKNVNLVDKSKRMYLVMGEKTGRCSLEKGLFADNIMNANKVACEAMGENFDSSTGRCKLKQLKVEQVVQSQYQLNLLTNNVVTGNFDFANALCETELNLLKKDKGSGSGYNDNRLWTHLCLKPQWAGCHAGGKNIKIKGTRRITESQGKVKRLKSWAQPVLTTDARIKTGRNLAIRISDKDAQKFANTPNISGGRGFSTAAGVATNFLGGGLGMGILTGDIGTGLAVFGANLVFMSALGPLGLVVAPLLMPKCDKYRAHVERVCRDGNMEVKHIAIQTQKMKRFKCKWRNSKSINPISDEELISSIKNNNPGSLPEAPVLSLADIEREALAEISHVQSIEDLIDEDGESTSIGESSSPYENPEQQRVFERILNAMESKEARVINDYLADVRKIILSIPDRAPASSDNASTLLDLTSKSNELKDLKNLAERYLATVGDKSNLTPSRRHRITMLESEVKDIDKTLERINSTVLSIQQSQNEKSASY